MENYVEKKKPCILEGFLKKMTDARAVLKVQGNSDQYLFVCYLIFLSANIS